MATPGGTVHDALSPGRLAATTPRFYRSSQPRTSGGCRVVAIENEQKLPTSVEFRRPNHIASQIRGNESVGEVEQPLGPYKEHDLAGVEHREALVHPSLLLRLLDQVFPQDVASSLAHWDGISFKQSSPSHLAQRPVYERTLHTKLARTLGHRLWSIAEGYRDVKPVRPFEK